MSDEDFGKRVLSLLEGIEQINSGSVQLTLDDVLKAGRQIWGEEHLDLPGVIVRMGVNVGKLCRVARGADKDYHGADMDTAMGRDLKLAMGHIIVSTIRWADDLGINVQSAVIEALLAQDAFARKNKRR